MAFADLSSYLVHLEAHGQLKRIRVDVDPDYEIAEIAQRVLRENGPALVFERVKGSRFPLAINFFGSFARIETALGMHPEQLGERLVRFAEDLNPPTLDKIFAARDLWPRFASLRPRVVRSGASQEVVDRAPDLTTLPIIKCWPQDGGRFITFPLVMTKSPVTGKSNLGIYRLQSFDKTSTGMHWQIHKGGGFHYHEAEKRGHALDVAVVLGADPALMLTGIFPLPEALEEIAFAGILRGRRTQLVPAKTIALEVPAGAEMVLEGRVPPFERHIEGPFGDHFGHYCDPADFPVFRVLTMTRKRMPIYPAAVVGKPPQEDRFMGDASQMIAGPLLRLMRPEVRDVWAYYQAGFHNLLVVSVEGRYTREPIRTAMGILGEGQLGLSKVVVLVGPDVNTRDFDDVLRAIREHFNARDNFHLISRAPLDTLDFTSFKMHLGSRMIIDATGSRAQYSGGTTGAHVEDANGDDDVEFSAPLIDLGAVGTKVAAGERDERGAVHRDDRVIQRDPKDVAPNIRRWRLWNDSLLAVQADKVERDIGRVIAERMVASPALARVKIIAVVSPDVDLDDDVDLIWGIFTRFDPARDIVFTMASLTGIQPAYAGVMGIDATWKPGYPDAVEMDPDTVKRVDERWTDYWR